MFLEVKPTGLQVELEAEDAEDAVREDQVPTQANGVGDELDNECCEEDVGVSEGE
jgi:hypothetical protein